MTESDKFLEMPWSIEDTIENLNKIKKLLKVIIIKNNVDGKAADDVKELEFDFDRAIKALEKQEKIKETFTHYAFSGYKMNVLNDCVRCLAEIKDILNGSDEE